MSYSIHIEGETSFAAEEGDTLLSAALRANVGFPYDCSSGGCGGCRFELVHGEIEEIWPEAPGLTLRDRKKNKLLACQCKAKGDVSIKVRTGSEYLAPVPPARSLARVVGLRNITHDMREITLKTDGAANFKPGQYALLSYDGLARPRAYSMSNLPNEEGIWQFIIRQVPGGTFTAKLFDAVEIGDTLTLDGPYGMAWLRADAPRDVLCISGGSGLAPMLSIARGAARLAAAPAIHFYFGARTASDVFDLSELDAVRNSGCRLDTQIVISNDSPGWLGPRGFVHEQVEKDLGERLADFEIYLAGPPPMVNAVQEMLFLKYSIPVQQVHLDRFF